MDQVMVRSVRNVRARVAAARAAGQRIGFVPTMGALHEGHLALVSRAVDVCDFVVVSIFVNPLQFGPTEDLDEYPQTLEADMGHLRAVGADLVFVPTVAEMYPRPQQTFVAVEGLTEGLCGASRPGHFRGVTTVVAKLFNIVQPDVAFFGQKDAQQAAVIQRMVADLCFPIRVEIVPTVREADGLALSSRNTFLDPSQRQAAAVLYKALRSAQHAVAQGERNSDAVVSMMQAFVAEEPLARLDYAAVVDADTLKPVKYIGGTIILALAAYIGPTRLIDNVFVTTDTPTGADA